MKFKSIIIFLIISISFFSSSICLSDSQNPNVFANFDDFPVTPSNQEATSAPTWTKSYTEALADAWTSIVSYPAPNGNIKNSFIRYINGYNSDHMGWECFGYLDIDNKIYASGGRSLRFVTTGGKNSANPNGAGMNIRNKGDFLQSLSKAQNPYASVPIGQQYIYFSNTSPSSNFQFFSEAASCDQLTMYVYYPPGLEVGAGGYSQPPHATLNIGPFTGQAQSHWYHYYYINGGGWIKLFVDGHPQHNNSFSNASLYPYPSSSIRNMGASYIQQFYRFYFASVGNVNIPPPYAVYFDEIEFSNTSTELQNFETIASPAILMKADKSWEISLNDKYKNNANSNSTYHIKYSFSPITNANWSAAKDVKIKANSGFGITERNDGKFQKWWPYYVNTWVGFNLDAGDEANLSSGTIIYFAIKDIGNIDANGNPTQIPNASLTGSPRNGGRAYDTFGSSFDWGGDAPVLTYARFIDYKVPEAFPSNTAFDLILPASPINLSASVSSSIQINLSWNPATDNVAVTGYKIYRNDNPEAIATVASSQTNYLDKNLNPSANYTYSITAIDAAGNESLKSSSVICSTRAIYYVDGSVSDDSGDGSILRPKKYIMSGVSLIKGGDTLIIKDGIYRGVQNMLDFGTGSVLPQGSVVSYTTIKAEHDGGVLIDGEGIRQPVALKGDDLVDGYQGIYPSTDYIEIRGIIAANSNGSNISTSVVNHIRIINCGSYDAADGNTMGIIIGYSTYVLVEGCYAWGSGRYKIATFHSDHTVIRNSVARYDRCNAKGDPIGSFTIYSSTNVEVQNCIDIDGGPRQYYLNHSGFAGSFGTPTTSITQYSGPINFTNCISLNAKIRFGSYDWNSYPVNAYFENCVGWDLETIGNSDFVHSQGNSYLNHCTFGKVDNEAKSVQFAYFNGWKGGNINRITNSIVYDFKNGPLFYDYESINNNDIFSPAGSPLIVANGLADTNTLSINPSLNSLKFLTKIESGSTLDSAGVGGTYIGAKIMKQIGKSGTLWGEQGYNLLQDGTNGQADVSLWPFPNENLIKAKMSAYSYDNGNLNGKRGFCADGKQLNGRDDITLTSYIWEYLGNPIPPEIYGSLGITVDINSDGNVDIIDIQICVNHILNVQANQNADVNKDGKVDVEDVNLIVNKNLQF